MFRIAILLGWYTVFGFYGTCKGSNEQTPVTFTFKEYQYKDSPKNEMTFREFETACEQSSACSHLSGLQKTRCVRECVSPSCYRELYQADPVMKPKRKIKYFTSFFVLKIGYLITM
ncbi:hypothetical protein O3G_MSEX015121 [Manduca sexta]|uniref:Secreted protein n=1 Tax=Manduca sexta TaxID=7130 RepID=A0A921ZXQ4_MANSE|nr:hypothetical protein O3G_MSEX015121 [Manduca sexta]